MRKSRQKCINDENLQQRCVNDKNLQQKCANDKNSRQKCLTGESLRQKCVNEENLAESPKKLAVSWIPGYTLLELTCVQNWLMIMFSKLMLEGENKQWSG